MALRALYDVPAPAKLNLFLHLIGRRDDGYHLLESLFVLIDWHDTLHFEQRDDGALRRHDLTEPLPADDLCLRAARLLQAESGSPQGVDISVHKRVPAGAGLGGGSSDAASTLLALNQLWGLHWPRERLQALGLALGADVPFFLGGDNAFVEGIGERLTPVQVPPLDLVVRKPAASLATAGIFAHPKVKRDSPTAILSRFVDGGRLTASGMAWIRSEAGNGLQAAAEDLCPGVAKVALDLFERHGNSRMTGSGSAVYALLDAGYTSDQRDGTPGLDQPGRHRSLSSHPLRAWALAEGER